MWNSVTEPYGYRHRHCNCNSNRDSYRYTDGDRDGHSHRNSNGHVNSYSYAKTHSNPETPSDTKTTSDPAASAVTVNTRLAFKAGTQNKVERVVPNALRFVTIALRRRRSTFVFLIENFQISDREPIPMAALHQDDWKPASRD